MAKFKTKRLDILLEDTYETYYWIGFLLADGHFSTSTKSNRIELNLAEKDFSHLLKFKKYIQSENKCSLSSRKTTFGTFTKATLTTSYKNVVNEIMNKFNIVSNKTYNPPELPYIENYDLFVSLLIGFIDGDGNISKLHKRKDFAIRIKIFKTWDKLLYNMIYRVYSKMNLTAPKGKYVLGRYYEAHISNSVISKELKRKAIELKLPVLKRKWNNIDLEYTSRQELGNERKRKAMAYFIEGKTYNEIATLLNMSYIGAYMIIKRLKNNDVQEKQIR